MVLTLSCFRAAARNDDLQHDFTPPARPRLTTADRAKRSSNKARMLHRHSSADSQSTRSSTYSNESISKLPPCHRVADPAIEAMMMKTAPEAVSRSKCMRLSLPKTYSDIVQSMKCEKGCRDWRNFAVFHQDDVDDKKTAEQYATEKRARFAKKWAQLNSFSSDDNSIEVDMIG